MFSLSECRAWMTIDLTVSVAIVAFNLSTIIVFTKSFNLRKRSTYLLINLAFVDMLVGGFSVYALFYSVGANRCSVWKRHSIEVWVNYTLFTLLLMFCNASLTNIAIIALERLHATFFPFRHHLLRKWVYGLVITIVWVTAALETVTDVLLQRLEIVFLHLRIIFCSTCLLIICVSYTSIVIKVRCGTRLQHHGAASRERKLTITLLIVTAVSLLLYLPYVILAFIVSSFESELWLSLPDSVDHAIIVLFYANSLVNPILYAIRLPEYRSAVFSLFCNRSRRQRQVADVPLRHE